MRKLLLILLLLFPVHGAWGKVIVINCVFDKFPELSRGFTIDTKKKTVNGSSAVKLIVEEGNLHWRDTFSPGDYFIRRYYHLNRVSGSLVLSISRDYSTMEEIVDAAVELELKGNKKLPIEHDIFGSCKKTKKKF